MSEPMNFTINVRQVNNGYVLLVRDEVKYDKTETIYEAIGDVMESLRKVVAHVEDKAMALAEARRGEGDNE